MPQVKSQSSFLYRPLLLLLPLLSSPSSAFFVPPTSPLLATARADSSFLAATGDNRGTYIHSRRIRTELRALTVDQMALLDRDKYVILEDFLPDAQQTALRQDVQDLRQKGHFNVARIGQDSTNALNTNVRVAETCFLDGSRRDRGYPASSARDALLTLLDDVRQDLMAHSGRPLDAGLTELLYAYYPKGGFYRKHTDALPGSASALRQYSLLLYLNEGDWTADDGGQLRLYLNDSADSASTGDDKTTPTRDVLPTGGTLVLFQSDAIPHEVLDTMRERAAVIGWYNKPSSLADVTAIAAPQQIIALAVSAALVTVGIVQLLATGGGGL